jgi:flagellin-like hook-associated protein FlgL
MVDKVSTLSSYLQTMENIGSASSKVLKAQRQVSSGVAIDSFTDLNKIGPIENYLSLKNNFQSIDNYLTNNKTTLNRITTMDKSLDSLIKVAGDMRQALTTRKSPAGRSMGLAQIVKTNFLPTIKDNLNSQFQGLYMFSGSKNDVQPVGDILNSSNIINGVITSNYYNGNNVKISSGVTESLNLEYGITANEKVFQNLIAVANKFISADENNDNSIMNESSVLINQTIEELVQLRAKCNNHEKSVKDANLGLNNQKEYYNQVITGIVETDIPVVMTELYNHKGILEASYKAFAIINKMNLTDYI